MGTLGRVRGWRVAVGLGTLCCVGAAGARPVAQTAWQRAVEARAQFEAADGGNADAQVVGASAGFHTKVDYNRVLDAFRAVYHGDPADAHAADAVAAVAELLRQEGRQFKDEKMLRAAMGQWEFLRTQYPASRLRVKALLEEGEIAEEDLPDAAVAKEKYAAVVKEAPRSGEAATARERLTALRGGVVRPKVRVEDGVVVGDSSNGPEAVGETAKAPHPSTVRLSKNGAPGVEVGLSKNGAPGMEVEAPKSGAVAQVTGIRHWSTASYTRVAIDLGGAVTFEAARVPHPDRIYFDLHGARLSPELVGKSFDVTDDGFLKRIRAGQSSGDVTRVVLDVNDVTEYSAFLLPNPYRLIIDIHGAKKEEPRQELAESTAVPVAAGATKVASAAADTSGLPAMAPTDGGTGSLLPTHRDGAAMNGARGELGSSPTHRDGTVMNGARGAVQAPKTGVVTRSTPGRPVPNTVAVKQPAVTSEVAAVSEQPGRVEATAGATSRPIVATVPAVKEVELGSGMATTVASAPTTVKSGKRHRTAAAVSTDTAETASPEHAAEKTADGQTSLVRALGLRIGRIVIDAGHGGHDSGTLGVDGIEEKDVVLDVALRLGKLLHERLGAEIVYTRSDDTFIPLETRTAIANKAQADLFLSIHANSSQDESARGVEVYYLNFTSDPTALDVAARENAVGGQGVHQLSDLVKKIALKDKIAESREFAADVDGSLYAGLARGNDGLKNRGVKKAPFVVLIGANMPSVLAEISFVTNPRDAEQLRQPVYRQRVAESLYNGVAKYESGLAGARVPVVRAAVTPAGTP